MRRTLVLTDEHRRHAFLASLPPHVREPLPEADEPGAPYWRLRLTRRDWRDLLATYCGAFVAVSVFIA